MTVGEDKAANFARAARLVREAAKNGAQLVALPVSSCMAIAIVAQISINHSGYTHV